MFRICYVCGVTLWLSVCATHVAAQTNQKLIVEDLLSGRSEREAQGLKAAKALGAAERNESLHVALIALLDAKNDVVAKAMAEGVTLDTVDDPEFIADLSRTVATLGDARAIPSLARAIYGGRTAAQALAAFGEPSVEPLAEMCIGENHYDLVNHGLTALTMLAEAPGREGLSKQALGRIRSCARARLTKVTAFSSLWKAIDLAVALNDEELNGVVQQMSNDRGAIEAAGVPPVAVEQTQERAYEAMRRIWAKQ